MDRLVDGDRITARTLVSARVNSHTGLQPVWEVVVATKVLARDDLRRPRDKQDLVSLLRIAGEADLDQARRALELIQERGFNRGRALAEEFAEAVRELRIVPPHG